MVAMYAVDKRFPLVARVAMVAMVAMVVWGEIMDILMQK